MLKKTALALCLILCTVTLTNQSLAHESESLDSEEYSLSSWKEILFNILINSQSPRLIEYISQSPGFSEDNLYYLMDEYPELLNAQILKNLHPRLNFSNPQTLMSLSDASPSLTLFQELGYFPELEGATIPPEYCFMIPKLYSPEAIQRQLDSNTLPCSTLGLLIDAARFQNAELVQILVPYIDTTNESDYKQLISALLTSKNKKLTIRGIELAKDFNATLIGIANYDGEFSGHFQNIDFSNGSRQTHLLVGLTDELFEEPRIRSKLDAFILPGANDTFPNLHYLFQWDIALDDMNSESMLDEERLYQKILSYAVEKKIPLLGTCAGNQHIALNRHGAVSSLPEWEGFTGNKTITLTPGTLNYYMALSPHQKSRALNQCELPDVNVEGTVIHSYAISHPGEDVIVSGTTTDYLGNEVIMASSFGDHIAGFQFHPEYQYQDSDTNNPNYLIIKSFTEMATSYKNTKGKGSISLFADSMIQVTERMSQCLESKDEALNSPEAWFTGESTTIDIPPEKDSLIVHIMPKFTLENLVVNTSGMTVQITDRASRQSMIVNKTNLDQTVILSTVDGTEKSY